MTISMTTTMKMISTMTMNDAARGKFRRLADNSSIRKLILEGKRLDMETRASKPSANDL